MAGQKRLITKLLSALEQQGCTIILTRGGAQVRFPDGKHGLVVHRSASDRRAIKNIEAQIKRHGLAVPNIRW